MSFTDNPYYKGLINIPFDNLNTDDFKKDYIDVYEEEILLLSMGRDLYNDFITGLAVATPDPKWIALRDGEEYTVTDGERTVTVKWEGLKNTKKISLLSDYVFVKWLSENYKQNTALGVSIAKKENAKDVPPAEKLVSAYKRCRTLTGGYPYYSDDVLKVLYPEDINEGLLKKFEPSLFNFLYYNLSDYPNWIFNFPDIYSFNMFDI